MPPKHSGVPADDVDCTTGEDSTRIAIRRQGDRLAFDELAMTTDHDVARMRQELNEPVPIEDPIISLIVGLVLVGHATGSHLGGNLHKPQRATVQAARARRVCRLGANYRRSCKVRAFVTELRGT